MTRFSLYVFVLAVLQREVVLVRGDCWYDNKKHEENSEVPTGEPCLNCTCNRSSLLCYLRVCPKLPNPPPPGCILLHRYKSCCPKLICSDFHDGGNALEARADPQGDLDILSDDQSVYENACISNGSIYGPGSAMHSSSLCEYCYCLAGKQVCVKPKCLLPIEGCSPVFEETSCCPVRYNCTKTTTEKTTTTSANPRIKDGCTVGMRRYPEGSKVIGVGHSVCDNCYCLRGLLRCEPLSCAPPLLGCSPVIRPGECCATSYNCNGTLEINPEPNYGLFPTISKEYSKLRKEVQRKPIKHRDGVMTAAPFYVLAETLQEPTTKLIYQRSPDTYGTTRHFSGSYIKLSTQKPLKEISTTSSTTEGNYFLISSSKQRSTTKNPSTVQKKVTASRSTSPPSKSISSSPLPPEKKEANNDYLKLENLNILSLVDSLLDGKMYRRVGEIESSSEEAIVSTESSTVTESTMEIVTTTSETTWNPPEVTTRREDESTLTSTDDTSEGSGTTGSVTMTTILKSTDCIDRIADHMETGNKTVEVTTILPISPDEVNKLAESRTDYISTTDFGSIEDSSSETFSTEQDISSRNTLNSASILPPDIEVILNISKHKSGEEFDYDYNEPTLPPSLPNLKIIPFVAADALDAKKESPKDPTPVFVEKKIDDGPLEYNSNMFKPPEETEGGFVPKEPSTIDTYYNNINPPLPIASDIIGQNTVINCISEGKEIPHGTSVLADSPCTTCTCFYGNVVCQKIDCPVPKPECKLDVEQRESLCCPSYLCDHRIVPTLEISPVAQEIVTVAEGIIPSDPFKDVIRTEPAPDLPSLIGDRVVLEKTADRNTVKSDEKETQSISSKTNTSDYDESFSLDKVLQFIFSGTPDVIEKPISKNPVPTEKPEEHMTELSNGSTSVGTTPSNNLVEIDSIKNESMTTNDDKKHKHAMGVGLLKLAGCNIYGRMYRVGRIISELSGPCLECKCTEIGVQCRQLRCSTGTSFNNG